MARGWSLQDVGTPPPCMLATVRISQDGGSGVGLGRHPSILTAIGRPRSRQEGGRGALALASRDKRLVGKMLRRSVCFVVRFSSWGRPLRGARIWMHALLVSSRQQVSVGSGNVESPSRFIRHCRFGVVATCSRAGCRE